MSGTTSICLQQQWHNTTQQPLVGGKLYSFMGGTLNPQNAYRVAALTAGTEYPNPLTLDASARVPLMFYADGLVRLLLTDKNGIAQFDYDNVPIIGAAGSGGGGPATDTTDVTRLFGTGDMKLVYGTGPLTGYVRGNAKTIGDAGSGATELDDPTAQALFQWFWNRSTDGSLPVLPTRGATALADWTDKKQIQTPDFRGAVIGGLDGMGNSRANRLSAAVWDILGQAQAGSESYTLVEAQLPVISHGHKFLLDGTPALVGQVGGGVTGGPSIITFLNYSGLTPQTTIEPTSFGGGQAYTAFQATKLVTVYFRL